MNRNVTINSLDEPDYIPQPQLDPIGYTDGRRGRTSNRPRRRMPFGAFLVVVLVAVLLGGFVCVRLSNWLGSEYKDNATFSVLVQGCLYLVTIALGVSGAVCALSLALAAFGKATKSGVVELPGGLAVHSGDVLAGWKRPGVAALAADTMQQHFDVQQTLAQQSHYRNVTAYSPSISTHYTYTHKPEGMQAGQNGGHTPPQLPSGPVPPFDSLLAGGLVGPGNPLLLGIDVATGDEVRGSWLDLYSTAVAGLSGGGKTTTQRFLAAQAAMHGAQFVCCDPHYGAADDSLGATLEPLQRAFLCEVADTNKRILDAVKLVRDIGERRITGKDKDATPLILWIDEATKLLGHSQIGPELARLLEEIAQQYRKRGVYASIAGQIWSADRTGGSSALRDSLASVLCHRMKRNQARMLLPTDEARLVERLPTGQAVLWRTSGETVTLAIPNTTAASLRAVGQRLDTSVGASTTRPIHFPAHDVEAGSEAGLEVGLEVDATHPLPSASSAANPLSVKARRVAALLRQRKSQNEIIKTIWGASGGRAYQEAADEYRAILAELAGRVVNSA